MTSRILLVTGSRVLVATTHEERAKALLTAFCEAHAPGTFCKPLDRNAVMVRETAEQRAKGAHVEVLGLEALWSTTRGTAYTLDKARKAGLTITHITFERSKGQ